MEKKKHAENVHQKLTPDPFLILLNNQKQQLMQEIFFEDKIFWNKIIKTR